MPDSEPPPLPLLEAAPPALPPLDPDFAENNTEFDDVIPTRGYQMLPMVGLGGSAGSIAALQEFFRTMDVHSGMVFVVILHLSPSHESTLAEVLGRATAMPVEQARDGQRVEVNHVYVIPPGKYIVTVDGHLRLPDLPTDRGRRVAVDLFFRSLADTHGPHAAAIVLSGADGDGAIGIKRIKERGGLTIAQDPEEAEHSTMPRTAIDTGMIDWVLQVQEMPARLLGYRSNERSLRLPPEEGPQPAQTPPPTTDEAETALREVLLFLRMRTGRDFSYYKRATILRRLARRMQVNSVADVPSYLTFLRTHPGETGALLQDLLISVTNFYRDRDAFTALDEHLSHVFKNKTQSDAVRVWVPACATGEEAYSIAILLLERAHNMEAPPVIQVFACDLSEDAIAEARAGVFPDAIAADVSEERLRRFFIKDAAGYRVRREVREVVLFAVHDLLKDAPFSRMDLISCRNLLIYLNRDAQKRAFETFHFALRAEGRLFLGSSETVDEGNPLFRVLDKKHRIFANQASIRVGLPVPTGPGSLQRMVEAHGKAINAPVTHGKFIHDPSVAFHGTLGPSLDRAALAELHFRLIERMAPPSVVINAEHEVVHLSEHAGRFLQLVGGEPTMNLVRMVHPMLRVELRAALFRAVETNGPVEVFSVPIDQDGALRAIDLRIAPAHEIAPGFLLVVFDVHARSTEAHAHMLKEGTVSEPAVRQLERELEQVKLHLRDTVEQYEASTEEMKASNEELQAMNEELRSATEELETSREELQSINEELTTVNSEMKGKVDELAQTNSDLQNLMASTSIATVFLDRSLAITRYTPSAVALFHLIPGDVGRPLAHLKHQLEYPELIVDADQVLQTLIPIEREVHDADRWYLARLLPYRTLEDHIAGVVLTFVDITERIKAKQDLAVDLEHSEQLRQVSEQLVPEGDTSSLFDTIVNVAIAMTRADAGTVQLLDAQTGKLHMLVAKGFPPEVAEHFARVDATSATACGAALASGKRVILDFDSPDEEPNDSFRRHLEAGLRTAQSTPLIARSGRPIGMISTHWKEHHRPGTRELRFLDLLARQAADAIERRIGLESLREQVDELSRFNTVAVGREIRMIELKKEINDLCVRANEPTRYPLDFEKVEPASQPPGK